MRAVNLMPRDEQRARIEGARTPFLIAAGGIVLVTAVSVLLSMSASGAADEHEARLADVNSALANLPEPPASAVSQGTLVRERSDRVEALAAALSTRVALDRVLREISYVFPQDAWLTQLEASAPEAALPDTGSAPPPPPGQGQAEAAGVTIQGAAFTHEAVASVLHRLSLVPSLQNVRLTASTLVEPQTEGTAAGPPAAGATPAKPAKPYVTFVLTASLAGGSQ